MRDLFRCVILLSLTVFECNVNHAKAQTPEGVHLLRIGESSPCKNAVLLSGQEQLSGQAFQQDMMITYKGYQYVTYYNNSRNVCLSRRKLPLGEWHEIVFPYQNSIDDSHNVISLGICANDGTIHLAFDHHNSPLHYVRSVIGLANNPETMRWDDVNFSPATSRMIADVNVPDVTYPRFFAKPDGNLFFECRYYLSGDGDSFLREYDSSTHTWKMIGRYVQGMDASPDACAYINRMDYDNQGRIHVSWCWRDNYSGTSNHDIYYAYSMDNGQTWCNTNGTQVASTEYMEDPTDDTSHGSCLREELTSLKVVTIPYYRGYINQESQTTDTLGRVHILNSYIPDSESDDTDWDSSRLKARLHHRFRDRSGIWHVRDILNNGSTVYSYCRSQIIADAFNNAIVIANGAEVYAATSINDYNDWGLVSDVDQGRFCSEPQIDHPRLLKDGVLSFVYLGRDQKVVVIDYLSDNPHKPDGKGLSSSKSADTNIYSGTLETLYGEQYTLYLSEKAKIYIDDSLLINKTSDDSVELSLAIPLIASHRHAIKIETSSDTQPTLYWSGDRTEKSVIPKTSFYSDVEKQSDSDDDYTYQPETVSDTIIPYFPQKQYFGGCRVVDFTEFRPTLSDFTLEVSATAGEKIQVGGAYFDYMPTISGLVRFAQKDGIVYVFQGDKYVKSIQPTTSVEYPDIFSAISDSIIHTGIYDSRNLFKNPGFERFNGYVLGYDPLTKPTDVRTIASDWYTLESYYGAGSRVNNVTVNNGYANIRLLAEGDYVFMLHGYGSGDGMKLWQQVDGLKPSTPYRIVYRHMAHSGTVSGDYIARIGGFSSNYFTEYTYETPSAGFGNYVDVMVDFATPSTLPAEIYFSISRTATSIAHFDRMTLVEGSATLDKGITSVTSATYLTNSAYAPELELTDHEYVDMSSFIVNPGFSSNIADGWSGSTSGTVSSSEIEFYNTTFDLSQQITDLPAGKYKLLVQGFHRAKANDYAADYYSGTETINAALYANVSDKQYQQTLLSLYEPGMLGNSENSDFLNGYVNSMDAARTVFDNELYPNEVDGILIHEGDSLKIGVKTLSSNVNASWTIFDSFQLFYCGGLDEASGINEKNNSLIDSQDEIVSTQYYDLRGIRVVHFQPKMLYILKKTFRSGRFSIEKVLSK